jgi:hypothetical protein
MRRYATGGGKERRASARRRRAWLITHGQPLKPRGIASPLAGSAMNTSALIWILPSTPLEAFAIAWLHSMMTRERVRVRLPASPSLPQKPVVSWLSGSWASSPVRSAILPSPARAASVVTAPR